MYGVVKFIWMTLVEDFGRGPEHTHDSLYCSEPIWRLNPFKGQGKEFGKIKMFQTTILFA